MRLREAIFEMDVGERFEFNAGDTYITKMENNRFIWKVSGASFNLNDCIEFAEYRGEIVKAKQEPATAEERIDILEEQVERIIRELTARVLM